MKNAFIASGIDKPATPCRRWFSFATDPHNSGRAMRMALDLRS